MRAPPKGIFLLWRKGKMHVEEVKDTEEAGHIPDVIVGHHGKDQADGVELVASLGDEGAQAERDQRKQDHVVDHVTAAGVEGALDR